MDAQSYRFRLDSFQHVHGRLVLVVPASLAAQGLQAVHSMGVAQCDISPRNFLLDSNLNLMISEFAGSSLLGSKPSPAPGERFQTPRMDWNKTPTVEEDIFGLGSLIYFIMTNKYLYEDVASDEVVRRYAHQGFPELGHLSCGPVIKRCWEGQIHTVQVVLSELEALDKVFGDGMLWIS